MIRRGVRLSSGAFMLASAVVLMSYASPAVAAPVGPGERSDLLWNAKRWLDYAALQEEGVTGEGVTVAVIDEAINTEVPELAGADVEVRGTTCVDPETGEPVQIESTDPAISEHGTNVVSMLAGSGTAEDGGPGAAGIAPKASVWFYGVGDVEEVDQCELRDPTRADGDIDLARDISLGDGTEIYENPSGEGDATALAARAAIRDGADIVSVSVLSGLGDWDQVLIEAQARGVAVVTGTPNPDTELGFIGGPWLTNGAAPVSAIDANGELLTSAATGDRGSGSSNLAFAAPGASLLGVGDESAWGPTRIDGSSYAAPILAGSLALIMQKYPDATVFQALQAMVRTTGAGGEHEPVWNDTRFGYGYANPKSALELDPRELPDVNPLFVSDVSDSRCAAPDGSVGTVSENGDKWACEWSLGPFPPQAEAYAAVVNDGAQVLSDSGERVDSVYGQAADAPSEATGSTLWVWIAVGGGIVVLVLIAVVVLATRKRPRAENHHQTVGGGHER
ncbi:hypothetical protein GCM10009786_25720 [Leucobacter alluvii]|uniref:Peptidase S8/S53 domain-containing protein n=1 Tax=Leucobacter alluvii TaxID=340321 RepID=A0ABN3B7Y8_9MICO